MGHPLPLPQVTSRSVQQCRHAAADRQTDTLIDRQDTQTRMTTIHFLWSTTQAKCNESPLFIQSSHIVYHLYYMGVSCGLSIHRTIIKWMLYGIVPFRKYVGIVGVEVFHVCFTNIKHCHCHITDRQDTRLMASFPRQHGLSWHHKG